MKTPEEMLADANKALEAEQAKVKALQEEAATLKANSAPEPTPTKAPETKGEAPEPKPEETPKPEAKAPETASKDELEGIKTSVADLKGSVTALQETLAKVSTDLHTKGAETAPIPITGSETGKEGDEKKDMTLEKAEASFAAEAHALNPDIKIAD